MLSSLFMLPILNRTKNSRGVKITIQYRYGECRTVLASVMHSICH